MPREVIQPAGIWDARDPAGHAAGTGLKNGNGRFAQVVKIGDTVYVAGQTPVDEHGQTVGKGDIEAQVRQVFENIGKCLEAAACTYDHVVKLNIYSTDIDAHLGPIATVRNDYFPDEPVANTSVQVSRVVHPDWLVEIEAVAVLD